MNLLAESQRATARRRHASEPVRPDPRRCRQRQDARADHAHRLADPDRPAVSPQGVLAVTFTNKAAKEMLTRLSAMLPINTRGMWIGTFHGLCNRMLRAHHRDAGLPQTFQILDSADQLGAIKRLLKAGNVDDEKLSAAQPAAVHQRRQGGRAARQGRRSQRRLQPPVRRALRALRRAVPARRRRRLRRAAAALLRAARPQRDRCAQHYQGRFRHILVDEFQDTNKLQYAWLKQLAGAAATRSSRSATTTSRSTRSAARMSATWPTSSASSGCGT